MGNYDGTHSRKNVCATPPWPAAGAAVALELDKACPISTDESGQEISSCPETDAWIGRLDKFKRQLEVSDGI